MDAWLTSDPKNIVVVHCLAGKGRTGVVIACYLLFSGFLFAKHSAQSDRDPLASNQTILLPSPAEMTARVLMHFRKMRGEGVRHPSQERIVRYFSRVIHDALVRRENLQREQLAPASIPTHSTRYHLSVSNNTKSRGATPASASVIDDARNSLEIHTPPNSKVGTYSGISNDLDSEEAPTSPVLTGDMDKFLVPTTNLTIPSPTLDSDPTDTNGDPTTNASTPASTFPTLPSNHTPSAPAISVSRPNLISLPYSQKNSVAISRATLGSLNQLRVLPLPPHTPLLIRSIRMYGIPMVPGGVTPILKIQSTPYQGDIAERQTFYCSYPFYARTLLNASASSLSITSGPAADTHEELDVSTNPVLQNKIMGGTYSANQSSRLLDHMFPSENGLDTSGYAPPTYHYVPGHVSHSPITFPIPPTGVLVFGDILLTVTAFPCSTEICRAAAHVWFVKEEAKDRESLQSDEMKVQDQRKSAASMVLPAYQSLRSTGSRVPSLESSASQSLGADPRTEETKLYRYVFQQYDFDIEKVGQAQFPLPPGTYIEILFEA